MSFSGSSLRLRWTAGIGLLCAGLAQGVSAGEAEAVRPADTNAVQLEESVETRGFLRSKLEGFPEKPENFDSLFQRPGPILNMRPPEIAPMPSRLSRETLDRLRNWAFVTPEDIVEDFMARQLLKLPEYGPDGREWNRYSTVERYYDRLSRQRGITNGVWSASRGSDEDGPNEANPFASLAEIPSLKGLAPAFLMNASPSRPKTLAEILGVGQVAEDSPDNRRLREQQERQLDAFRKSLDIQFFSGPGAPNERGSIPYPNPAPNSGPSSPVVAPPNSYATLQGPYDPTAVLKLPKTPGAPTAPIAPGQPDPTLDPSYYLTPRIAPPKPEFSIPQRRF